jgi:hypothetical protein
VPSKQAVSVYFEDQIVIESHTLLTPYKVGDPGKSDEEIN